MAQLDSPNINAGDRSNEQNIQSVIAYLTNMADELNYLFDNVENRLQALEQEKGEREKWEN